ncbi:lipoyl domain-containing protein [Sphingobium subterraneum]|uniref:Pyruvate/2-oxoglutarate dehydrogenase complex dihydrolipoamide acyltransferase (E2) component n=1 Tax=Sphingobium subterraneum TaxID=627688 RepID=A0A841J360_9SPHN|nr:lipoyl domain-containing protein [Sphingobium subterraneum]MBB6125247.1 pyruvate/2-oxoglutarate dehydrogenase complex dihydrolipoamide acyltransferase (E2) component [Sphingobium subterraneum]
MKITLKLARIGMSMQEATIAQWHKKPGESFSVGDPLYAIETDKITQDIEATADGTMMEIFVEEGEDVEVGTPLCSVDVTM